jgi:hypothetical protein
MDYNSIIKDFSNEKKDLIVALSKNNKRAIQDMDKYDNQAIHTFFNLWKEMFPNQKQSKNCLSCRKSVCHFFHTIADYIISERETPEVVKEAEKEVKTQKKKVYSKKAKVSGKAK